VITSSRRVDDALVDALRQAAEHDRVDRADPRAPLHRDDRLDRHRQVDEHAVALADAELLQPVGELADPLIQLLVGDLRDRAVVRLEDDRGAVRLRQLVPVEAVVRRVEVAVLEPLVERGVGLVQHLRERLVPHEVVPRELRPVALVVVGRARLHLVVVGLRQVRLRDPLVVGNEQAVFLQDGFDRGHAGGLLGRVDALRANECSDGPASLPKPRAAAQRGALTQDKTGTPDRGGCRYLI
jgi:hypothetical protein